MTHSGTQHNDDNDDEDHDYDDDDDNGRSKFRQYSARLRLDVRNYILWKNGNFLLRQKRRMDKPIHVWETGLSSRE